VAGVSWLTEPDSWENGWQDEDEPRSRGKLIALIVAGWLVVSLIVLITLLLFHGNRGGGTKAGAPTTNAGSSTSAAPRPTASTAPAAGATLALPAGWDQRATDDQSDCAAHAYGRMKDFFLRTPCSSVHRVLATSRQGNRQVVIAAYAIVFASTTRAQAFTTLVNADGTGNVSDLLREGVTYPGGPRQLPDAAFAAHAAGTRVVVAEAAYATGTSSNGDPHLKALAQQAVTSG
jgi:hypothetical protein